MRMMKAFGGDNVSRGSVKWCLYSLNLLHIRHRPRLITGAVSSSPTLRLSSRTTLLDARSSSTLMTGQHSLLLFPDGVNRLRKHIQESLLLHDVSGYPPDIASFPPLT